MSTFKKEYDDYDLLIGIDIITQTDFLITNKDSKTIFQFRTPQRRRRRFIMAQKLSY